MIVWPKQSKEIAYDANGFRQNLQALIIKKLKTENTAKQTEKMKIWEEWLGRITQQNWTDFQELKMMIRSGIPDTMRVRIWPHLQISLQKAPADYQKLLKTSAFLHSQTINLDLTRTFPNNIHFAERTSLFSSLSNVLNVLSVAFPQMGYCQGLNFICAVVLLKLQEEHAYKFLYGILNGRRHHEMLEDVSKVRLNLYVFDRLLQDQFKMMHRLITDNEVEPIQYASSWFLTLFCGNLPFEYCLRVLQCYLMEGEKVLYRVALTIMKYKKRRIKALADFDQVLMHLKDYSQFETISPDEFFDTAFKLKLTSASIEQYRREYEQQLHSKSSRASTNNSNSK